MRKSKKKLNIKKGYKIVSITRTGKLRSYALWRADEGCIEYNQNCWVSQPLFSRTRKVQYNNFPLVPGTRFARRVRLLNNTTVFQPGA